jgi:hypothetical protein
MLVIVFLLFSVLCTQSMRYHNQGSSSVEIGRTYLTCLQFAPLLQQHESVVLSPPVDRYDWCDSLSWLLLVEKHLTYPGSSFNQMWKKSGSDCWEVGDTCITQYSPNIYWRKIKRLLPKHSIFFQIQRVRLQDGMDKHSSYYYYSLGPISLCHGCTSALGLLCNPKYSNQYIFSNAVPLIKRYRSLTETVLIYFGSANGFPKTL